MTTSSDPAATSDSTATAPPEMLKGLTFPPGQLADKLGITITDWNPTRMVATMPVEGNLQPLGLLHGGASAALAETLGSTAAAVHSMPAGVPVGIELSATHHRAAHSGVVTAVCTPLHAGGTLATYQIVITDDRGKLICTAKLTALIRRSTPGADKVVG